MNPLTFISNISNKKSNNKSNIELINDKKIINPEIIALCVFIILYIIVRLIEKFIVPFIPSFMESELSSFFKWGSVLVPIIFGFTYYSKKNTIKEIDDKILKKRMIFWKNKKK
jgi:hypothetical protein